MTSQRSSKTTTVFKSVGTIALSCLLSMNDHDVSTWYHVSGLLIAFILRMALIRMVFLMIASIPREKKLELTRQDGNRLR